jgi:hypothetical protein
MKFIYIIISLSLTPYAESLEYPPLTLKKYCKQLQSNRTPKIAFFNSSQLKRTHEMCQKYNNGELSEKITLGSEYNELPEKVHQVSGQFTVYHYFKSKEIYDLIKAEPGRGDYFSNKSFAQKLFASKFQGNSNDLLPALYFSFVAELFDDYGPYLLVLKLHTPKKFLRGHSHHCKDCDTLDLLREEKNQIGTQMVGYVGALIDYSLIDSF